MGWFEEQIKERKIKDNEDFSETMEKLSGIITGDKSNRFADDRERTQNAVEEILRYYHAKPKEIPDSVKDINDRLEYVCRPYGIMRRRVTLEGNWYKDAVGAMLGSKKDGTVVALIPCKFGGYSYFDDTLGKRVKLNRKTRNDLEKDAICFYKPFPVKKMGIPSLIKYIFECIPKTAAVITVITMIAATLLGMITPKITNIIFSDVITTGSMRMLLGITVLSVCVTISSLLVECFKSLIMNRINTQLSISVQAATMARILSLPADFFKDYGSGELSSRAQYINSLCSTLVSTFMVSGLTSVFSLVYITQVFKYAPALVVPSLCILGVTVAYTILITVMQMKISREQMKISSKESSMTYSLISGIQKIKMSGSEKRAFTRWAKLYSEDVKYTYGLPKILILSGVISTAITLTGNVIMYFFAVKSGVTVANYYSFTAAYGMVAGAFMSVVSIALNAARIKPVLEMAKPVLEAVPEISEEKKVVTKLSGAIEINNLSFRYNENMPMVLDNISLKIRSGQYVAIVGRTGCGKSTLLRLLLGFEKANKGAVYYDGKDVNSLDLKSLRRNIGAVMQNGKLFQGDIFSNIIISAPWLTVDDAWKAAEIADIADDIRSMPMGMNTMISEGSGGISGGQKQRLMIARAVAPNPKILMFDEATSALDNVTQKKVSEALDNLKCTRIVIAHRLSTIRHCDRIIVLDGGKIVEDGTYDELIAHKGFFAELVERQRLDS